MAVTGGMGFLGFIETRLTGRFAEDPVFRDPGDFFVGESRCVAERGRLLASAFFWAGL